MLKGKYTFFNLLKIYFFSDIHIAMFVYVVIINIHIVIVNIVTFVCFYIHIAISSKLSHTFCGRFLKLSVLLF